VEDVAACDEPEESEVEDIIIYEKRERGRRGPLDLFRPPSYAVSRINELAHTWKPDPDL
jgi:hypothetical protein